MTIEENQLVAFPDIYKPGDTPDDMFKKASIFPLKPGSKTIEIPNTKEEGYGPILRNDLVTDGKFIGYLHPDLRTVYDLFQYSSKKHSKKPFLGRRRFDRATGHHLNTVDYYTYDDCRKIRDCLGSGIVTLLEASQNTNGNKVHNEIATIYLSNCPEFDLFDLATQSQLIPNTSLYSTLSLKEVGYIIDLVESSIIITTPNKIPFLVKLQKQGKIHLSYVIVVDSHSNVGDWDKALTKGESRPGIVVSDPELYTTAKLVGISLITFEELIAIGFRNPKKHNPPTKDSLFTIGFTSGTTGLPKGTEVLHSTAISQNAFAVIKKQMWSRELGKHTKCNPPGDYGFLPRAHVFLRTCFYVVVSSGCREYYPLQPENPLVMIEDMKIYQPTFFPCVPRILSKIEAVLRSKFDESPYIKKAVEWKIDQLLKKKSGGHFIYDNFICPKIRAAFGFNKIDLILEGSAPSLSELLYFIGAVFNVRICQGYLMLETFCSGFMTNERIDNSFNESLGLSGGIYGNLEAKTRDLGDYKWADGKKQGELLLRGPVVVSGYYKRPDAWAEVMDKDGWYCTSDIVSFDKNMNIHVIGRVKDVFKLALGLFVSAETIQAVYSLNSFIDQVYVYGDSTKEYLVGVFGVMPLEVQKLLAKFEEISEFSEYEALVSLTLKENFQDAEDVKKRFSVYLNQAHIKKILLEHLNKNIDLQHHELLRNAWFGYSPFILADNTITPTLKIKRKMAENVFKKDIEKLYREGKIVDTRSNAETLQVITQDIQHKL